MFAKISNIRDIVAIELPAMEVLRNDLIVKINTDKQQLLALEDKVLKLLFQSKGNILDDEELVETLNDAKVSHTLPQFSGVYIQEWG